MVFILLFSKGNAMGNQSFEKKNAIKQVSHVKALSLVLSLSVFAVNAMADTSPIVTGWVEKVAIPEYNLTLKAKVDSGADSSSLHAVSIHRFTKNNQAWVQFRTQDGIAIQKPVLRIVHIKTKTKGTQAREVVELPICLAGQLTTVPVNLVDRGHFSYPMLIGRSAMEGKFLINPHQKFLTEPKCGSVSRKTS